MIAIDASTLILMAKTELLDLFLDNSGLKAFISRTVEKESTAKGSFDASLIERRIKEKKVFVKGVKNQAMVEKIGKDFRLHAGEAETIVLCVENRFRLIGTDDFNAMKACVVLNVPFTSAVEILLKLNQKNILTKKEALAKLGRLEYYGRYSGEIVEDAKKRMR